MTAFLLFLGFIALLIAAWAPARIRDLRSGLHGIDDLSRDSDRRRTLNDLNMLNRP